jgi:RNA polymerase sigma factor (TIGR02999 family)
MNPPSCDVTALLRAWSEGDRAALDALVPLVYGELRRQAARYMRDEPAGHTLQATALVHEAYLRLVDQPSVEWQDRAHFLAVAANAMRRILVDRARARHAAKRGGAERALTLSETVAVANEESEVDVLVLHEALIRLAELDPRQARVVELRYFGGLSIPEAAVALGVSHATVERDWRNARLWLRHELSPG